MAFRVTPLLALMGSDPDAAKAKVLRCLKKHGGNIRQAALELELSRNTLMNYIDRFGLSRETERFRGSGK